MKSPLRYPGGKTRAIKILKDYIPSDCKEICSPFFGGGSFEFYLASKGITIYGYDNFEPLANFFHLILNGCDFPIWCHIDEEMPLSKERFYEIQKQILTEPKDYKRAALFYVLNRASFSGSTLSGGMSPNHPRFKKSHYDKLSELNNLRGVIDVTNESFEESIKKHDCLIFADPPYYINQSLYGNKGDMHKGFNHKLLADMLIKRSNFLLTYNDCPEIRELYKGCRFDSTEWSYGMNKSKISNEVIIIPK